MNVRHKSFYPFLFAIYPLLALFARLPGGISVVSLIRPIIILLGITFLLRWVFNRKLKNIERANFLTAFALLFFSTTGYVYKSIRCSFWRNTPAQAHLFFALFGMILIFFFFHPLMWEKYLTDSRLKSIALYLNLVSVIAILPSLFAVGNSLLDAVQTRGITASQFFDQNKRSQDLNTEEMPDIYYIILDAYMQGDALEEVYDYNNQEFLQALEERGFYIADQSRSNYMWTMLSLSSSLNMDYLDPVAEKVGRESAYSLPLYELNQHSTVRSLLEDVGYHTAVVSTGYGYTDWRDAEYYFHPYTLNTSEIERYYLSMTVLGAFYQDGVSLVDRLAFFLPLPSDETRRQRIHYAFNAIPELVKVDSPKFVFVHVLAPHPPFVLDQNGDAVNNENVCEPPDGSRTSQTVESYHHDYLEQLQFVNRETLKAIDLILADTERPKVILLQGDHGGASLLSGTVEESCLLERTSVLNAYYFPDGNTEALYSSITPVNSFRIIFNTYFGANYPILADKTYFSTISQPYNFVDVSEKIENTCDE